MNHFLNKIEDKDFTISHFNFKKKTDSFQQKRLTEELLHKGIIECYLLLVKATKPDDEIDDGEGERNRLLKLSNLALIDYIRSMCQLMHNQYKTLTQGKTAESPRDLPANLE
jgi:hypothetical protein